MPSPIYVSPTEPPSLKQLYDSNGLPEKYGCDLLWSTPKGLVGIQRKTPEDLVASVRDGRISKQTALSASLVYRVVMIEGYPPFTVDGEFMSGWTRFTKSQWNGTIFSLHNDGWWVIQCKDRTDLTEQTDQLYKWSQKARHGSTKARSGPSKDSWGTRSFNTWGVHILTSIPGIGNGQAVSLLDTFKRVPLRWDESKDRLLAIKGIGPKTLSEMLRFIASLEGDEEYEEAMRGRRGS